MYETKKNSKIRFLVYKEDSRTCLRKQTMKVKPMTDQFSERNEELNS